jgi:glycosyltransferase involved in cell wall biosynthesis
MKNKKSILYIIGDLNIGGTEKHLLNILPYLQKEFNVSIYTFKEKGELAYLFEKNGIKVNTVIFSEYFKNFPKFFKMIFLLPITIINLFFIIFKIKPKIIHMFLPESYLIGSISSYFNINTIKIMSRRSKNYYFKKKKYYKYIEKFFHKKTNLLVANSQSVLKDLKSECSDDYKIKLIYNGVKIPSTNKFNVNYHKMKFIKKKYKINDEIVIIFLANLIPYKNHAYFINIANQIIKKNNIKLKFLIVGQDRGIKNNLINMLAEYNIKNSFDFIENIKDPEDLFLISDISILCSIHEGFSNAILEAMSYGLPVVASNVGGNKDSITNNKNGYLFNLENSDELYLSLMDLINNKEKRIIFGQNSLKMIHKKFNIDYCVNEYISMYNKALTLK